jgi:ABC-type transport system substrate-binding protein
MRVVVWASQYDSGGPVVVATLQQLGYRASLRRTRSELGEPGVFANHAQIGYTWGYSPWFPSAAAFIGYLYGCQTPHYLRFCDPVIDAHIRAARAAAARRNLTEANARWGRVERELVDQAGFVTVANESVRDIVSHRVGNYRYHPLSWILLGQMWVR